MRIFEHIYKKGNTIIVVTHDSNIAEMANNVIELTDGNIVE